MRSDGGLSQSTTFSVAPTTNPGDPSQNTSILTLSVERPSLFQSGTYDSG